MNVLHVIGSLDPRMGGLPRAVVGLAAAQAGQGDHLILAHGGALPEPSELLSWTGETRLPETLTFLALPVVFPRLRSEAVEKKLNAVSADWLQVHGLWEPVLHAAMRWADTENIPFGITPHSMMHPWHARRKKFLKDLYRKGCELDELWSRAKLLHALTPVEAGHWEPILPGNVRVVPNGIHPHADQGNALRRHPRLPQEPFLLFMGRLHPQKAPELLLEAFARIAEQQPELHLVLAGPDYGSRTALMQRSHRLHLQDRVHLPGTLDRLEKWDALHRCRLFCLPSRAEGFSLAVLEAALAGAPCLISEECGFPELVDGGGARTAPLDASSLAEVCMEVLASGEQLQAMGEAARNLVLKTYSWQAAAASFRKMLQEQTQDVG